MTGLTLHQVTVAVVGIYSFGFGIILALCLWRARRKDAAGFAKTLATATALIAALTVLFLLGPKALMLAMPAIVARISFEVAVVRFGNRKTAIALSVAAGGLAVAAMLNTLVTVAVLGLLFLCFARLTLRRSDGVRHGGALADVLVFPVLPAILLAAGTVHPPLTAILLAAYLMVEIFDSFALFFGAMWGRTKAFPVLSPNKTVEGLLGGGVTLLALSLITAVLLGLPLLPTAGLALYVGAMAVAGDLAASRHKRIAGVKDYPKVLPRQGGLLDSLDSWIATGAGLVALTLMTQLW